MNTCLEWESERCIWQIMCGRRQLHPDEIRNREFLIGVSLRNPRFSNSWIRNVITDIISWNGIIWMCLVDVPYFETLVYNEPNVRIQKRQLAILYTQCEQHERRLQRLTSQFSKVIHIFRWNAAERLVPEKFFVEIRSAFLLERRVYSALLDQVRMNVAGLEEIEELKRASVFLLNEIPVLLFMYYRLFPDIIDVYPGPQAEFFWELERGTFTDEMPISTQLACQSEGLIYADVQERRLNAPKAKSHPN